MYSVIQEYLFCHQALEVDPVRGLSCLRRKGDHSHLATIVSWEMCLVIQEYLIHHQALEVDPALEFKHQTRLNVPLSHYAKG